MQSKPAGAPCLDRQVYLEIKYLGYLRAKFSNRSCKNFRPDSSPVPNLTSR
jgi:hypothetical protein